MTNYCRLLIIFFTTISMGWVSAQAVEINNIELESGNVRIRYNLNDSIIGRYYTVRIYTSQDNYLNPLKELSGDAGMEISPGANRVIIWNARQELGSSFNGDVALELRARVYIPFINVEDFNDVKTLKRHQKHSMTWSGGRPSNILNFNLYRGDEKVTTFSNIANVGHHDIELPAHIKPGKGYYFIINDSKNKDEVVRTSEFRVRRKIPLLLKIIPVIGMGGAATFIASASEGSGSLPGPPETPINQ